MLKCENLEKRYMTVTAISNLNLEMESGRIYALLGPNGSGKSTLMKMISGLAKPSKGSITLDGEPLTYKTKARIAYMPTEAYFFEYMNCMQAGNYYADFFDDFNFKTYLNLLAEMDLNPEQKIKEMSSGMMAKMKIAITLSRNSKVVMLDEPLNGIDIIARDKIINTIIQHISDDTIVIISSHLVDELEKIVDNAIFIKSGSCVLTGEAEALRQQYGKSIVELYKEIYA